MSIHLALQLGQMSRAMSRGTLQQRGSDESEGSFWGFMLQNGVVVIDWRCLPLPCDPLSADWRFDYGVFISQVSQIDACPHTCCLLVLFCSPKHSHQASRRI